MAVYQLKSGQDSVPKDIYFVAIAGNEFYLVDEPNLLRLISQRVRRGVARRELDEIILNFFGEFVPAEIRDFFRGVVPVVIKSERFNLPDDYAKKLSIPEDLTDRIQIRLQKDE